LNVHATNSPSFGNAPQNAQNHPSGAIDKKKITRVATQWYRTVRVLLLLLIASALVETSVYAQNKEPISLAEYSEKLHDVSTLLTDPADPAKALAGAEIMMMDVRAIRLPSGAIVVPHSLIKSSTKPTEDNSDSDVVTEPAQLAAATLQRVQLAIQQIELAAEDNTDARLDALESVFALPQFSQSETLWQRFTNWIYELIARFWPSGNGISPTLGQLIAWAVVIIGGIGLIILLSYWLQGLFGSFAKDAATRQQNVDGTGVPLSASQARQQASQYAQTGNYREAVRSLYLSSLLSMEESGVIRYDRSLTNREVLNQLHTRTTADNTTDNEAVEEHLRPIVETFDAVWYGVREPDATTFESYEQEIDGLAAVVKSNKSTSRESESTLQRSGQGPE